MSKKLIAVICLLGMSLSGPAMAGMYLEIDVDGTTMTYNAASKTAGIVDSPGAQLVATLKQGIQVGDTLSIYNSNPGVFDIVSSFQVAQVGVEDWKATGTVQIWDISNTLVVDAVFTSGIVPSSGQSDDVYTVDTGNGIYKLHVDGYLSPVAGNEAILTGNDPWVMKGEASSADNPLYGGDGIANQITIPTWESWDSGDVLSFHYQVDSLSLDTLFASNFTSGIDGDVDITLVPVPAAVWLGMLGLGVAGARLRKRKHA